MFKPILWPVKPSNLSWLPPYLLLQTDTAYKIPLSPMQTGPSDYVVKSTTKETICGFGFLYPMILGRGEILCLADLKTHILGYRARHQIH